MTNYKSFLTSLTKLFDKIENTLDDSDRRQTALAYWTIGKKVYEYKEETGTTIKQVALDLELPPSSLQQYVLFYKVYPEGYPEEYFGHVLGWSDFRAVLAVKESNARQWYLKEACRQQWSSHELRRRIRINFYENQQLVSKDLPAASSKLLAAREQRLYTYSARVLKVIDGDTLKVEVDVGFSMRYETKVRLRGINCSERKTKRGEAAKQFVENELFKTLRHHDTTAPEVKGFSSVIVSECSGVQVIESPLIVIKTYKTGKYGRFIADVWYLSGETDPEEILNKGKMLNQALLDKGLAVKVE